MGVGASANHLETGSKRSGPHAVLRVLLWIVGALVVVVGAGATYQAVATAADARSYPPPGQLVDIGQEGRALRLHLDCQGTGSPTVILEGAQGGLSSDWAWVQPEVAATTRVCAYDRAGIGWSDPGPAPRDAASIAQELHALLGKAGVAGPYVLVGHSYGGLYVRAFAAAFPADVAGVVLVDSSHPDQWDRMEGGREIFSRTEQTYAVFRPLSRIGVPRLIHYNRVHPDLPARAGEQHKAMLDTMQYVNTGGDEFAASAATSEQVRRAGTLGGKPLLVLSATEHGSPPEAEQLWSELQGELATLSSNSIHRVAEGADHGSLLINQNDARATTAAISAVVAAARSGLTLNGER